MQEYQVTGQTTVPETKHIQVQKMVAVMETVMVPRQETRTVMVPEQRQKMVPQMETQAITVPKVVQTQQTMQRTVGKIIEGSKFIENERVFEYERPRPRLSACPVPPYSSHPFSAREASPQAQCSRPFSPHFFSKNQISPSFIGRHSRAFPPTPHFPHPPPSPSLPPL